jgi:hypothetical protein
MASRELALQEMARRGLYTPQQAQAMIELHRRQEADRQQRMAYIEPALTMATGAIAEPVSGLVGLTALPFGVDASVNTINRVQDALTYQPRTEAGQEGLQAVGEALQPISMGMQRAEQFMGDTAYDLTGSPAIAAGAASLPTLGLELIGLKGARAIPGQQYQMGDIGQSGLSQSQKGAIGGLDDIDPLLEIPTSDKMKVRREARLNVYDLPTKGSFENINHINDLFDYSPSQLVDQLKVMDSSGSRVGGYYVKGDGLDTFYKSDGTSQLIDSGTGEVIMDNDLDQTDNLIKNEILTKREGMKTQEQKAAEYQKRKADDEAARQRQLEIDEGYKMQHTAPMREDNPAGDNLTNAYGEDIYTGNALRYYGTGADYDQKAISVIQGMKGKPNKQVTIYRAVPKDVTEINASDWVTTTREYAKDHMAGEKGWHILSKKVKAKDIANDGNSIHEFGYDPVGKK